MDELLLTPKERTDAVAKGYKDFERNMAQKTLTVRIYEAIAQAQIKRCKKWFKEGI